MTREDVLAALRRSPVPFEVAGLSLWLQPWTARTRAEFSAWQKDNPGPAGLLAKIVSLSVCDERGALLFNEADAAALDDGDGAILEAIADRVIDLNGLGGDAGKN